MVSWPMVGAANNAEWCDAVCRSHGIDTQADGRVWSSRTRTPPLYPDAVTLVSDLSPDELLARVGSSAGCSIKDSFASLDLAAHGFRVLLRAQWIARPPTVVDPPAPSAMSRWSVVRGVDAFIAWERAWRGHNGPADVLRPALVHAPGVTLLAQLLDDRIVGGAVLNGRAEVVGISNFFTALSGGSDSWRGCLALASTLFPRATLVGYETGEALDVAIESGFESVGPLQVWIADA